MTLAHRMMTRSRRLSTIVSWGLGFFVCLILPSMGWAEVRELKVNVGPFDVNQSPSVTVLTDERFVVGWHEGGPTNCFGRGFSQEGSPLGPQFLLHPPLSAWKYGPALAPLPDGGYVAFFGWSFGVLGQRFDDGFNQVGGLVDWAPIGEAWPVIAALANGDIVVVGDHQFAPYPVIARRYNPSLVPYGPPRQVNISPPGERLFTSAVAGAPNGNYTVAWYTLGGDIIARTFDASDTPLTDEFFVNSSLGGRRFAPSLAYNSKNELVIAWHGSGAEDSAGIYARRFLSDGTPLDSEWQVNETTAGSQHTPNLAIGGNDEIVISWTSPDASGSGVFARLYN